MDFFPREIMLTALYLACKSADFPIGVDLFTSHLPRNRERYRDFIVNSELFLMEALQYDLWIHTPYRPLAGFIVDLVAYHTTLRQRNNLPALEDSSGLILALKSEGYEIIHTWFQTDLCLMHSPSQFALAVLVELGRSHPDLEVKNYIKREVCNLAPLKQLDFPDLGDDEEESSDAKNGNSEVPTPEQRYTTLMENLEQIQAVIGEFEFVSEISSIGNEENVLLMCRNPIYNPESEEYAAAKERANSLLAFSE